MIQASVCLCTCMCVCVYTTLQLHTLSHFYCLALTFSELLLLILMQAHTCTDRSERCVGACWRVCLANPLSQSLEWKAKARYWWRGERRLEAPDCRTAAVEATATISSLRPRVFVLHVPPPPPQYLSVPSFFRISSNVCFIFSCFLHCNFFFSLTQLSPSCFTFFFYLHPCLFPKVLPEEIRPPLLLVVGLQWLESAWLIETISPWASGGT